MQESICSIASASETNLELQDGLAVDDITRQAYSISGENGLIHAADQHTCQGSSKFWRVFLSLYTSLLCQGSYII